MPDEAFAWMSRLKAVQREYAVTRKAVDEFQRRVVDNPNLLTGNLRRRDIVAASDKLEGTYVVRLFSEFETALKYFLTVKKIKVPKAAEPLVKKVRDRARISDDDAGNVHLVRDYRNALVHDRRQPTIAVSLRDSTRYLSTFLSWLQRTW
jgi:hypothetical protein